MMKRILVTLMISSLLMGSASWSVEKRSAPADTGKRTEQAPVRKATKAKPANSQKKGGKTKSGRPADFDDFVDKNNNGIDDRIELRKSKQEKNKDNPSADSSATSKTE